MKKNCKLRIRIDTEIMNKLQREADDSEISLSELIRQKISPPLSIVKILAILEDIQSKLNNNRR